MIYREKCAYHLSKNKKIIDKLRLIIKYKLNETSRKKLLHNEPSDVAGASQMKHPTTSQWNVAKTSQWYVFTTSYWYVVMTSHGDVMTTSHQYVSTTSQTSLKWNTQWRLSATSLRRLSGTYPPRPISTSLRRLL